MRKIPVSRLLCALLAGLMALSLAACGGQASASMSEADYQVEVIALAASLTGLDTSLDSLSGDDRETIETVRGLLAPFRAFAAIDNPPEAYAAAHAQLAEGCRIFSDTVNGLCDAAVQVLDGAISQADFLAYMDGTYTDNMSRAGTLLTEGFTALGMLD